jgi:hypothetical protein
MSTVKCDRCGDPVLNTTFRYIKSQKVKLTNIQGKYTASELFSLTLNVPLGHNICKDCQRDIFAILGKVPSHD